MVAAAVGGGAAMGLIGSAMSSSASKSAAKQQAQAANNAANLSMQQYNQTRQDLSPYTWSGVNVGMNGLDSRMNELTANFNPTMEQLVQTPGYQFTLDQGLKAAQNGYAAKGLGVSGAAMKGAADYASGLAQNTLSLDQQIWSANQQNAYNKLMGVASLGENAAAQTGSLGQGYTNSAVNAQIGGANALAAGQVGSANAWANGLNGIGNAASTYAMYNALKPT